MPDDETARAELARAQEALVRALVDPAAPVPEGFDAARVRAAAEALGSKRMRAASKAWPRLASALGASFATLFDAWARGTDGPPPDGAHADAAAFGRHLAEHGQLPDDVRPDLVALDLHAGARVRAWWSRRKLVLGARLPLLGVRIVRFEV